MQLNKIYNEDCLDGLKRIPSDSIDLVIIDPPYDICTKNGKINNNGLGRGIVKLSNELKDNNLVNGFDLHILDELVRVMKNINIYIWCNGKQVPTYISYFVQNLSCKLEILIWGKTNPMPLYGNRYLGDKEYCLYFRKDGYCKPNSYEDAKTIYLSTINVKDKQKYGHPTIKPLPLIRKLIRNSSKENDTVLDCFLGSGTTAVACVLENRKFIGFEINKKYYDIALKIISEANKEVDINDKYSKINKTYI